MYAAASKLIATQTHVHGQEDACTYRINPRHAPAAGFGGDGAQAQERQGRVRAVLVVHSKASHKRAIERAARVVSELPEQHPPTRTS
jgi:hypothetical protein